MTYEPYDGDDPRYVDDTRCDPDLLADLEALIRLGFVETIVRGDGELSVAPVDDLDDEEEVA